MTRLQDLLPVRYGRISASPFTFLRGSATVMAHDLAATPATGLIVQACGDAHLSNFGGYGTPERNLVFDLNDFDETLPAPWEWDVKRLAASFVIASRANGFRANAAANAARAAVRSYREKMAAFAPMSHLDVWYTRIGAEDIAAIMPKTAKKDFVRGAKRATRRDHLQALAKMTTVVDGEVRIVDDPPIIIHHSDTLVGDHLPEMAKAYRSSIHDEIAALLDRYTFVDFAQKAVGVGSVGTRCYVVLMQGNHDQDPLFLQIKEAGPSALEPFAAKSKYNNHGQRVVHGQRHTQAASDIFLGWGRFKGVDFYVRQLRDMKGSIEVALLSPDRWSCMPGSAAGRWPGRTPGPATRPGSRATSAAARPSTRRSPPSPLPMPTRPSVTMLPSSPPSGAAGSRPNPGLAEKQVVLKRLVTECNVLGPWIGLVRMEGGNPMAAVVNTNPTEAEGAGNPRLGLLLAMAMFVLVVDTSMMNVSISAVVKDLDTTVSGVQSAIALEALVSAAFILINSKIGDLIGRKRAYVLGLLAYAIGALAMTLTQSLLPIIIFWAILGGLGASLLLPAMQSLIHGNFAGKAQAKVYALVGAAAAIAAAVGPLIGGFITTYLSWRIGFLLEVVIIAIVLSGIRMVKDVPYTGPRGIDTVGAIFSVLGMGGVVLSILVWQEGGESVGALLAVGVLALAGLAWWLIRRKREGKLTLLDPDLFRSPHFRTGVSQQMLQQIALGGSMIALPIFLQMVLEYDAMEAGLSLAAAFPEHVRRGVAGEQARRQSTAKQHHPGWVRAPHRRDGPADSGRAQGGFRLVSH